MNLVMKNKGLEIGLAFDRRPALLERVYQRARESAQRRRRLRPPLSPDVNVSLFSVDHPEQFPLVTAPLRTATAPKLVVTGTVNPDISRNVPVISLATGRVVAIHARLGDTSRRGSYC